MISESEAAQPAGPSTANLHPTRAGHVCASLTKLFLRSAGLQVGTREFGRGQPEVALLEDEAY